jgi:hypothetical protein
MMFVRPRCARLFYKSGVAVATLINVDLPDPPTPAGAAAAAVQADSLPSQQPHKKRRRHSVSHVHVNSPSAGHLRQTINIISIE